MGQVQEFHEAEVLQDIDLILEESLVEQAIVVRSHLNELFDLEDSIPVCVNIDADLVALK